MKIWLLRKDLGKGPYLGLQYIDFGILSRPVASLRGPFHVEREIGKICCRIQPVIEMRPSLRHKLRTSNDEHRCKCCPHHLD